MYLREDQARFAKCNTIISARRSGRDRFESPRGKQERRRRGGGTEREEQSLAKKETIPGRSDLIKDAVRTTRRTNPGTKLRRRKEGTTLLPRPTGGASGCDDMRFPCFFHPPPRVT